MIEEKEQVNLRCVCGHSSKLPFCDGSHQTAKWSCKGKELETELLVAASPTLYTYAERLAHFMGGRAAHQSAQLTSKRLIRLIDLHVSRPAPYLNAEQVLNVSIGVPLSLLTSILPVNEALIFLEDDDPTKLWRTLKLNCKNDEN